MTQRYKEKVPASPQAPRASLSCLAGAETQNTKVSPESPHPNPIPILAENGPLAPVLTVLAFPVPCNISVPAQPGSLPQSLQNGLMLFQGLEFSSAWSPTPTVRTLRIRLRGGGWGVGRNIRVGRGWTSGVGGVEWQFTDRKSREEAVALFQDE